MQPLTDGPRASLSEDAVRGLLQSHSAIQITYGADALDGNFGVVADIGDSISAGQIISASDNATARTCQLTLDSSVTDSGWSYLSGYVRPYMTITDMASGVSAQFRLGVYTLTTPDRVLGTSPGTLQMSGYDLTYLLRQQMGDSYEVPAGADPAQAAAAVVGLAVPGAAVQYTPSTTLLPSQLTWALDPAQPVTYWDVVNTLLASIGYRSVWVDWDGVFRIEPWLDLQLEEPEWVFDTLASDNLMADNQTQSIDLFDVPNWFRFVMADLTDLPVEGVSQYTWQDTNPSNPGSLPNRGIEIRHIESVSVTNFNDLLSYGQRVIQAMLKPSETFQVTTQPFPLAWHYDVIQYLDPNLAVALPVNAVGARRVVATSWTLDLTGATDMTWTWQTINDQDAGLGLALVTTA